MLLIIIQDKQTSLVAAHFAFADNILKLRAFLLALFTMPGESSELDIPDPLDNPQKYAEIFDIHPMP